jgi:hypothetical protein
MERTGAYVHARRGSERKLMASRIASEAVSGDIMSLGATARRCCRCALRFYTTCPTIHAVIPVIQAPWIKPASLSAFYNVWIEWLRVDPALP